MQHVDPQDHVTVGGIEVLSGSDEQQRVYFQDPSDRELFCQGPTPDAAPAYAESLSLGSTSAAVGGAEDVAAGILGGRSPSVLIARELLYRACEFSLNYRLDRDEAMALYQQTLALIERIAITQTGTGSAAVAAAADSHEDAGGDDDDDDDDSDD